MVLTTVTPEATQSKKNGCQFQQKTCLMPGQHIVKLHITTGKKQAMLRALYAAFLTHGVKKLVGISAVSVLIAAKLHPQRGGDTKSRKEHLLAEEDTACQSSWIALWEHHSAVPAQGVWPPAQR